MLPNDIDDVAGAPDEPFLKGVDAYQAGKDLSDNPYEEDQPEHHDWMTGWYSAESRSKG